MFCKKLPESIIHFFCECEVVKPIWNALDKIIRNKHDINFASSSFEKMFGIQGDKGPLTVSKKISPCTAERTS